MKKIAIIIVSFILLFTYDYQVYAKDTIFSINKYSDERLDFIEKSYNEDGDVDGFVAAGTFLKEKVQVGEEEYLDVQIILIKYGKTGKVKWTFSYGKSLEDELYDLSYSYDSNGVINGYLLAIKESVDTFEEEKEIPYFVRVSLDGKLEGEVSSNLGEASSVSKLKESYNEEGEIDGYILIGKRRENDLEYGFLAKYDLALNHLWTYDYYGGSSFSDVAIIKEENKALGYAILSQNREDDSFQLLRYDLDGHFVKVIRDEIDGNSHPQLVESSSSYILYGITHNVKLNKNKSTTFYLAKYLSNDEEEWESVGNTAICEDDVIRLSVHWKGGNVLEYLLMSINDDDRSIEVLKIDVDGSIKNKVKKIKNDYYDISSFLFYQDVMYFVGQINCPEDDNCDYDANSLFLISDEDKVIEVKDNDSKNILIGFGVLFVLIFFSYFFRKKYRLKRSL